MPGPYSDVVLLIGESHPSPGDLVLLAPYTVVRRGGNTSDHARWSLSWAYQSTTVPAPVTQAPPKRDVVVRSFVDIDREVQSAKEWRDIWT